MKSTQVLKELQQLRKEWRLNNFHFTADQKKKYDELTLERREIVKDYYANDKVWIGPSNIKLNSKEVKKDDK
tara:strand:+ start:335 stop:550 length:216 start_codon:yes stop_codon:yes gene_type:complete